MIAQDLLSVPDEIVLLHYFFSLIILSWNLIYFSIHYFNHWSEAETEKWKLAAEMQEAQLASLKTQINPHFVFNALNISKSLIRSQPKDAEQYIISLSEFLRNSYL